jgi:hypothetical protein
MEESTLVSILAEDVQVNGERRDCPTEGQMHYRMVNSWSSDAGEFLNC